MLSVQTTAVVCNADNAGSLLHCNLNMLMSCSLRLDTLIVASNCVPPLSKVFSSLRDIGDGVNRVFLRAHNQMTLHLQEKIRSKHSVIQLRFVIKDVNMNVVWWFIRKNFRQLMTQCVKPEFQFNTYRTAVQFLSCRQNPVCAIFAAWKLRDKAFLTFTCHLIVKWRGLRSISLTSIASDEKYSLLPEADKAAYKPPITVAHNWFQWRWLLYHENERMKTFLSENNESVDLFGCIRKFQLTT